jgi:hypothetical protein
MTMPKPFFNAIFTLVLNGRNGRNRTDDPCFPKAVRYQAALHPEDGKSV